MPEADPIELAEAFAALRRENPTLRARDAADRLGVSEGALTEARVGAQVERIRARGAEIAALFEALEGAGPVMTLTRNDDAVHETTGPIGPLSRSGALASLTGAIDLRLFLRSWRAAYHVEEETRSGLRRSFQIFDTTGTAALKIYATDATDGEAWNAARARFGGGEEPVAFDPPAPETAPAPEGEVDRAELRARWTSLGHSHDFFRMLRELGVSRLTAMREAGDDLARRLDGDCARRLLESAAERGVPIMCFVGNAGCLQIYSGKVARIVPTGPWINVLDPGFNLHLRTDRIASAWLVRKPTSQRGTITSVELFDSKGGLICQFFGSRGPGETERPDWRALAESLVERRAA